jgi:hypothetical protein
MSKLKIGDRVKVVFRGPNCGRTGVVVEFKGDSKVVQYDDKDRERATWTFDTSFELIVRDEIQERVTYWASYLED